MTKYFVTEYSGIPWNIVVVYTIQPAAVPTASWVSTGVYEAKGVNPDSKYGGRDPKAVDVVILLITWHPLQLC
jgi:hypothetical protein